MIDFAEFWQQYPRKAKRPYAKQCFERLPEAAQKECIEATKKRVSEDAEWLEAIETGVKKFIPHPSTYLNNYMWQDDYDVEQAQPVNYKTMSDSELIKLCGEKGIRTYGKTRFDLIGKLTGNVIEMRR